VKIGIAAPISLNLINCDNLCQNNLPATCTSPIIAALTNGLLEYGHEVIVYTHSQEIDDPITIHGNNITVCIGRRQPHAARDLFLSERKDLISLMLSCPAEIINAHWTYEFALAALATGMPTLVTLHDYAPKILKYQVDCYRLMRLIMNNRVLRKAKYLSANSVYIYNMLKKKDFSKARITSDFYGKTLEKHAANKVKKSNYIVSVNNGFGGIKNISTALQAFSLIRRKAPDIEFHLVGADMEINGPAYHYAIRNNLGEGVFFIGNLPYDATIEKIKKALLCLHASREESFGNAVLESMVLETPVVGGRHSGNIPFLLDKGNAGILCDINSPKDMADGVCSLLFNEKLAQELVLKAKMFAKENFTEESSVQAYINYYTDILAEREK